MAVQSMGAMFPAEVIKELFSKVKGHSTLAKLSGTTPIAMTGTDIFTFAMDQEAAIVGENAAKSHGGITVAPVNMKPLKIEYGARVSDEFMRASEERQLDILTTFTEGWAKKLARAIDIMAMHGVNPRGSDPSTAIGTNSLDTNTSVTQITYTQDNVENNIESAITAIGDNDNTGYAFSKPFAAALGKLRVNGVPQYPEFKLGGNPGVLNGTPCDINSTVSYANDIKAYVGDFANAFKYGIAKDIPLEIIPYGNPDNDADAGDLKGHNQIYLRAEAYVGWGILDGSAFARIKEIEEPEGDGGDGGTGGDGGDGGTGGDGGDGGDGGTGGE